MILDDYLKIAKFNFKQNKRKVIRMRTWRLRKYLDQNPNYGLRT